VHARLIGLQRTAGNAAVTGLLAVQRDANAKPGDVSQAATDLYGWLVANAVNTERVLTTILLQKDNRESLKSTYQSTFKRSLDDDLAKLGGHDTVRARCYLRYGTLRPADKIYIAINGAFTDTTTVKRVLPDIRANRVPAEKDFADSYGGEYPTDEKLPNGETSRIGGALSKEMLSARFSERFEAWAVLAFGTPRPADDIKIATVDGPTGVQAPRLFAALQRDDIAKVRGDFATSYGQPLTDYLSKELFLHTKARALMLVDDKIKPEDRLIETVRISTSGYTTADWDFISDAARSATPEQIKAFKEAVGAKDARLKDMTATLGGMNSEQLDQFNALINVDAGDAMTNDPVVKMIRRDAGTSGEALFAALKNSTGAQYLFYKNAYLDTASPLRRFVDHYIANEQKGYLQSYVFIAGKDGYDSLKARLKWAMTNPGYDDYVIFLLSAFAAGPDRKQLAVDPDFGSWFSALSTATQHRGLLAMQPASMTPVERAVWLDAAVKRETASGVGSLTKASDALTDENRELSAARERIAATGKPPTPEQQAELDQLAKRTEGALTAFVGYRDQFEAAVSSLVEIAASLVVAFATGGAGVEVVVMAMARAAAASAMAKVVSRKVVMGDRFDVVGADGAAAFVSGAVEGALNVVGAGAAKNVGGAALEEAATVSARQVGQSGAQSFASTTGAKMAEGAFVGGVQSAVDTAVQDRTWTDGFDKGMRKVLESGVQGAALGAAPPALATAFAAYSTFEAFTELVNAMPPGQVTIEKIDVKAPDVGVSKLDESVSVQREPNWGKAFEDEIDRQARFGLLEGLPYMTMMLPGAHNHLDNGIDRIGVVINPDGTLAVYHFEMKWRNPPKPGDPLPKVKLNTPEKLGHVQTGGEWTSNAIELLCNETSKEALMARDAVRGMLARTGGRRGDVNLVSMDEVKTFLRGSLTARRVVVIPTHVDDRTLMRQIGALVRWGVDITVVRART
jgi:hypothetical protein